MTFPVHYLRLRESDGDRALSVDRLNAVLNTFRPTIMELSLVFGRDLAFRALFHSAFSAEHPYPNLSHFGLRTVIFDDRLPLAPEIEEFLVSTSINTFRAGGD